MAESHAMSPSVITSTWGRVLVLGAVMGASTVRTRLVPAGRTVRYSQAVSWPAPRPHDVGAGQLFNAFNSLCLQQRLQDAFSNHWLWWAVLLAVAPVLVVQVPFLQAFGTTAMT